MKEKEYPEADALIYALDDREDDAKDVIQAMAFHERRRLQEALANLSYWIAEVNAGPQGNGILSIKTDC